MLKKLFLLTLLGLNLSLTPVFAAETDDQYWEIRRIWFAQAMNALAQKDWFQFQQKTLLLQDYPLYSYLRYQDLRGRFILRPDAEIQRYQEQYTNVPFAKLLQRQWLKFLSKEQDWPAFIRDYVPQNNTKMHCQYIAQRWALGQDNADMRKQARALWTVGKSQPAACDPVFDYLIAQGEMTDSLIWARLKLAFENSKFKLAAYLIKKLESPALKQQAATWQQLHHAPALTLSNFSAQDSPIIREMLTHSFLRLAKKQLTDVPALWSDFKQRYAFSQEQKSKIQRTIALQSAWQEAPQALAAFKALPTAQWDKTVQQVFLQTALKQKDWKSLLQMISKLPAKLRHNPRWSYWQARALQATGKWMQAEPLWQKLAKQREFYGFLAADKLGLPYAMNKQAIALTPKIEQALYQKHPGVLRAREFYYHGMLTEARREWNLLNKYLAKTDLETTAALARQWCWFDQAIFTAAKAGAYDDLDVRFPLNHFALVMAAAEEQSLVMPWIYGIIRQESAFNSKVVSHAGAMGLMQLMPATGKHVAKRLGLILEQSKTIFEPYTNIRLGAGYLRMMLNRFSGNYLLATAAYNAGPGNVNRWLKARPCEAQDIWVELIPFKETRRYVQSVMLYMGIYEQRLMNTHKYQAGLSQDQIVHPLKVAAQEHQVMNTRLCRLAKQKKKAEALTRADYSGTHIPTTLQ
ncbi:Soluble lytic murein transglycosylase precursor [Candidatus Venteria ishoeyi]|uniref:Soluble lytic murein transglycosylase n=2 Tax=Candidatus Venteria ishoeyi TaxID=1899563 RepID=A0A1H6FFB9_9GAMM|nr:Soluble lytic murein transglycosylase precursor [Candidatus Venteria ishoeyi]